VGWYNAGNNTAVAGGTTVVVTFGSGSGSPRVPAAGDLVVVVTCAQNAAATISSVIDSQGNTYTAQVSSSSAAAQQTTHWTAAIANAVSASDTITVTYGSTLGGKIVIAKGLDGASSATADKTNSGTATSTSPSSGSSGTLSQAAEGVIGSIADAQGGGAPTAPSFGAFLTLQPSGSGFGSEMDELVNATTAQTASGTIVSAVWAAAISAYKLTAPSVTARSLPNGTQGVVYPPLTLTETGGTSGFTWSVSGGSLTGSGLSLSSAGVLSGTGGTPGTYNFTAQVQDGAGQTATRAFTVTINAAAAAGMFPLPILVELLLGGAWTDITSYVYQRDGITITGGAFDEGEKPQPAQATITLNNRDGRFSPNNVSGAYYPNLKRNTQLRISLVNATSSSGNIYSGYRFWGTVADWPPQSDLTQHDIFCQITANGPLRQLNQGGGKGSALTRYYGTLTGSFAPIAYWPVEEDPSNTGTIGAGLNGGTPMTVTTGTPAWRTVTFNGSVPIGVLNKSTWDGLTGSFGGSGDDVFTVPGTYTWIASTATVDARCIGAGGGGSNGHAQGGGGGGGFIRASAMAVTPGTSYTVVVGAGGSGGAGGFSSSGNSGVTGGASTFTGDAASISGLGGAGAPNSGTGGAGGSTTGTGTTFTGGAGGNFTFSGDGGAGGGGSAGTAANGNAGHANSVNTGGAGGAAVSGGGKGGAGGNGGAGSPPTQPGFAGTAPGGGGGAGGFNESDSYGRQGGSGAAGQVELVYTPPAAPPINVCRFAVHVPAHGAQNNGELIRFFTGGTVAQLRVLYGTGGKLKLQGYSNVPALLFDSGFGSFGADGKTLLVSAELSPSGSSVAYKLTAVDADAATPAYVATLTGTQATASLGNVSEVTVGPNADITKTAIGHISVQYALIDLLHVARALNGHDTELTVDRLIRLANEQALSNVTEFNEGSDHWSFESGTNSWGANNAALTQSTVTVSGHFPVTGFLVPVAGDYPWPTDGTHSLLATCNGAGPLSVFSPSGTSGGNILPGDTVSAAVDVYTPVGLTSVLDAAIGFFTSGGASVSTTSGATVGFAAGQVATLTVKAVAPATAAFFNLQVNGGTEPNNRLVYVDNARVSPQMGVQSRKEYKEFLEEIKDLDQGILKEDKANFGLKYRTRYRLINQSPAVTLDFSQKDVMQPSGFTPFSPVFDDQKIKNDVTVHRHKGSRVRVTLDQGGQTSIQAAGRYRKSLKVVANNDAQIAALAAHLLNLGTVTKERYPTITVDLTRAAANGVHIATIMSAVASAEIGDYVQVINLPFWFPSSATKQLIIGYTEVLNANPRDGQPGWAITWNCTPEDPWEIVVTSLRRW
jgi:hypothetical protein